MNDDNIENGQPPQTTSPSSKPKLTHRLVTDARLKLLAVVYRRQSSLFQRENNWGSALVQLDLKQVALDYGWPESSILVLDDLGESGTIDDRPAWKQMLQLITNGVVGAVLTLNVGRLSREVIFSEQLRLLAELYDVLLFVDGRPIDPEQNSDVMMYQVEAVFHSQENRDRTKRLTRAKYAKTSKGHVSYFPTGFIKKGKGAVDFDPETSSAIKLVYRIFREKRSLWGTVVALNKREINLPRTRGGRTVWKRASLDIVKSFIVNPFYSGRLVFGRTRKRLDLGRYKNKKPKRRPLPENQWLVNIPDHHECYITEEEQREFLDIIKANRPGGKHPRHEGPALCQGLLQCSKCGAKALIHYAGKQAGHQYQCSRDAVRFGDKPCFTITGRDVDAIIERKFLQALTAPSTAVLKAALEEARRADEESLKWMEDQRQRLAYEEKLAEKRFRNCDPENKLLYPHVSKDYDAAMRARREFEQNLTLNPPQCESTLSDVELEGLCHLTGDIPKFWNHPKLTHKERKELIRCLIDKVIVNASRERLDLTICWESGRQDPVRLWRRAGYYRMIEELNNEGFNVHEIQQRLREGLTDTGQKWQVTVDTLYAVMHKRGIRPNKFASTWRAAKSIARDLYEKNLSLRQIADELNQLGYRMLCGKEFKSKTVFNLLKRVPRRMHQVDSAQRNVFSQLESRGLSNKQIAEELNRRKIPRQLTHAPWTVTAVKQKKMVFKRLKKDVRTESVAQALEVRE